MRREFAAISAGSRAGKLAGLARVVNAGLRCRRALVTRYRERTLPQSLRRRVIAHIPLPENPQSTDPAEHRRERLRFTGFRYTRSMHGDCTVSVELEWNGGGTIRGEATGPSSPVLDLRVAAEAALRAVEDFGSGEVAFDLIGVKHVRAFDASVIIVAIGNRDPHGPGRLLGSYLVDGDPVRGTVIAVLAATNRLLGNVIARR